VQLPITNTGVSIIEVGAIYALGKIKNLKQLNPDGQQLVIRKNPHVTGVGLKQDIKLS
jgi:hypothetical protein